MSHISFDSYLESAREGQLDALKEWLRIPSISTLAEHRADVAEAAAWVAAKLERIGIENVEIIEAEGHPTVYADWLHAGPDAPTLLIYGHYDVQPVDPLEAWSSPPFEPTIRGDSLFARGASDDKGQTFIHLAAVEALLRLEGALPVNVKFLIEGEEEIGSKGLTRLVYEQKERLAADACLISDSPMLAPDKPLIVYGLRGGWMGEIRVQGPTRDLHSGMFGGAILNPNQALCEMLAALHDERGRITVPGFYDGVEPPEAIEREHLARIPYGETELLAESGAPAAWGEPDYSVTERIGVRPTLEINGISGGFTGDGFKTVIPSKAIAKVSCRLVPGQDPLRIGKLLADYLDELAHPGITVEVHPHQHAPAVLVPLDGPEIEAAARAVEKVFGRRPYFSREGGSIPVAAALQDSLGIPIIMVGFGLPDDNLHAPNEKIHLPNFFKGIRTSIALMEEIGRSD